MKSCVLLVSCIDKPGIIASIAHILWKAGHNIMSLWEHAEKESGQFFMRVETEHCIHEETLHSIKEILPEKAKAWLKSNEQKRIILFATKEPHCLGDILMNSLYGDLKSKIEAIISNHNDLEMMAKQFGVPYYTVTHNEKSRENHEEEIKSIIKNYNFDFIVLAKYMRILSPNFIKTYKNKIINIHHSFLPAFIGARPYRQAYERGVKIIGATAHFVTDDLDDGPIIRQNVKQVDHSQSATDLKSQGRILEATTLTESLRLLIDERVFICGNKTVVFE